MNEVIEVKSLIYTIRGQKVMLDSDLATLYGVETKRLNEAVKRNIERFPSDFMFQLSEDEFKVLRSQIATSKEELEKRGGRQYLPYVFTEQGVAMLSSVLRSKKAIEVNVQIMRTFVRMRQWAIENKDLSKQVSELRQYLFNYCKENEADKSEIYKAIDLLLDRTKPTKVGF